MSGSGPVTLLDPAQAQTTFGSAECQCATTDFQLVIRLDTALPLGTTGTADVWVGQDCDRYENRAQPNGRCERIATPTVETFTPAGPAGDIVIPSPARR